MTVMAPSDENECRQMLYTAFQMDSPSAVRYPRGAGIGVTPIKEMKALKIGLGEICRKGEKIAILAFGSMLKPSLEAAEELNATVANMRFVKPLDDDLILSLAENHDLLVTIEENTIMGGAGSAVLESLESKSISTSVLQLGLPDTFIDQGDPVQMLVDCGRDKIGIIKAIRNKLSE
jgi:1-deoxy-D-xylulose-5-phosphate synthase